MMKTADIRARFLKFFADRGHTVVESSALVPGNDPTLLFTNAGMVQFKDVFLGREKRDYVRAASSQRCVRAGGKHNDLENVGYTARHHTFFEMLGNFSFGDYFKREAIEYAWKFLTEEMDLPAEKLWVTVYEEDEEAASIWLDEMGVDPARFSRIGAKDNFWSMGDTGPCGPCTEIFFDHGPEIAGGPPGTPEEDGDRYVEIWNLVFMQYDRAADGTLTPLPRPSVDTGMGLERVAAVMQGVHSNYEIDLFQSLIRRAAELTGTQDLTHNSLRVIADHIRSCAFLITDGVVPSNEGRGYVLRRIIRRAARHGYELGQTSPFFSQLTDLLAELMGEAFPELVKAKEHVARTLLAEEQRFAETLEQGMKILDEAIASLKGDTLAGETLFQLYDTYGFPVDLTADIAQNRNLQVDMQGFEAAMEAQRERARAASSFGVDYGAELNLEGETEFLGYDHLVDEGKIEHLFAEGESVTSLQAGQQGMLVLDRTPFYAESGGQVGDRGIIRTANGAFEVVDCRKQGGSVFAHVGKVLEGTLSTGEAANAEVAAPARTTTECHHSATHLLHAALRKLLGEHVNQKGSLVDPERLRFDFSHPEPVSPAQLQSIEAMVNAQIRANLPVEAAEMSMDDAKKTGAMALFGEKYGDQVRVLRMGDFSIELCGGTHVARTGDIGFFKIITETGTAAGVRRIEAVAGAAAEKWVQQADQQLVRIADQLKAGRDNLEDKLSQLMSRLRDAEKTVDRLKGKLASSAGSDLSSSAVEVGSAKVVAANMEGADTKALRDTLDQLKNKLGSAIVVLAAVEDGKVRLVAGVTSDLTAQVKAGELVNMVAQQVGGKGGGRPDMAQAGGTDAAALPAALDSVVPWVNDKMS